MSSQWVTRHLSDVIELHRGYELAAAERVSGPYPVLSAGIVSGTHVKAKVEGPGFAIGRATNLGRPAWSNTDYWPLNTTLYAKDFKGNNPRWLFHLFEYLDLSGFDSGSVQPMLNRNYIASVPILVPPRSVQDAIADVLGAFDDKIAANRRILEVGQSLLRAQWEKLTADSVLDLQLSDIAEIAPSTPTVKAESATYLEMKDLPEDGLLISSWGSREPKGGARFKNGDTLLARITPCFENKKAAWVDFLDEDEIGYGSTEYIVLRAKEGIPAIVPYLIGTSDDFRDFAAQTRTGTSGRQRVQARELKSFSVPIPDAVELKQFGEFSKVMLDRLRFARDESLTLAATRDELLPLLISGKITVREAEKKVVDL